MKEDVHDAVAGSHAKILDPTSIRVICANNPPPWERLMLLNLPVCTFSADCVGRLNHQFSRCWSSWQSARCPCFQTFITVGPKWWSYWSHCLFTRLSFAWGWGLSNKVVLTQALQGWWFPDQKAENVQQSALIHPECRQKRHWPPQGLIPKFTIFGCEEHK